MPLNVKIVDIDTLKSGNRVDAYNSRAQNPLGFDLRVIGTLSGVTVDVYNPFFNSGAGTTISLVEGVDWSDDPDPVVTLKNLIRAIVEAADTPVRVAINENKQHQPVIEDPNAAGEAIGRIDSPVLSAAARQITITATGAGNETNLLANGQAAPSSEPASNGSMDNAEDQLANILNNLSPVPTDIADVKVEPLGIEGTRLLIYWPS